MGVSLASAGVRLHSALYSLVLRCSFHWPLVAWAGRNEATAALNALGAAGMIRVLKELMR